MLYDLTRAELVQGDPNAEFPGLNALGMSRDEQDEIIAALEAAGGYSPTDENALASVEIKVKSPVLDGKVEKIYGNTSDAVIYTNLEGAIFQVYNDFDLPIGGIIATSNGPDSVTISSSGFTVISGDGRDSITTSGRDSHIYGGNGDDFLYSYSYSGHWEMIDYSWLYGGAGDDFIQAYYSANILFGGEGNDSLWGGIVIRTVTVRFMVVLEMTRLPLESAATSSMARWATTPFLAAFPPARVTWIPFTANRAMTS